MNIHNAIETVTDTHVHVHTVTSTSNLHYHLCTIDYLHTCMMAERLTAREVDTAMRWTNGQLVVLYAITSNNNYESAHAYKCMHQLSIP